MFFSDFSAPKSTRYKFAGQLRGHTDSIYTVAMSRDGILLASGGAGWGNNLCVDLY